MLQRRFGLSISAVGGPLPVPVTATAVAVVLAVASTVGVGSSLSGYDEQRVLWVVLLATLAGVWLLRAHLASVPTRAYAFLLGSVVAGLVSSWLAPRPYLGLLEWATLALMGVLICSSVASQRTVGWAAALFAVMVATCYGTGVVSGYVAALLVGLPVGAETFQVALANPRFPAQLQLLTIPLLPLAWRLAPSWFWRACVLVVAVLWWCALIGSGSRTAWIGLTGAAIVVVLVGCAGRRWVRWQSGVAVLGAGLYILAFWLIPDWLGAQAELERGRFSDFGSVGSRLHLWRIAWDAIGEHPWLGVGPMHYAYLDTGEAAHPHKFWLQLASEWGLPVACAAIVASLVLWASLWRKARAAQAQSKDAEVYVAVLAALTAWMIGVLADGLMVVPTSQMASFVVLMLAAALVRGEAPPAPPLGWSLQLPLAAGVVVAIVVLCALPFTSFGRPIEREAIWREAHLASVLYPRFWRMGKIAPTEDPTAIR